jgi:hypothetical protein
MLRRLSEETLDPQLSPGDGGGPRPRSGGHPRDAQVIPKPRTIDCPTF